MLIPILMYHDIQSDTFDITRTPPKNRPYIQRNSQFVEQIEYFKKNKFNTLTVSELGENINDGHNKKIVITFDDGDSSNYELAFKFLMKNNFKATFFITTDFINKPNMVSWEQLNEMHSAGMEIGSHTVSHPIPSELSEKQLMYELVESKRILEDGLGSEIKSFSLPTGYYNPLIGQMAYDTGYSYVCTSHSGFYDTVNTDLYHIKRIAIKRTTGLKEFVDYVECKKKRMFYKQSLEQIKNTTKKVFGSTFYEQFRNILLNERRK